MSASDKRRLDCLLAEAAKLEAVGCPVAGYRKLYEALTEEEHIRAGGGLTFDGEASYEEHG